MSETIFQIGDIPPYQSPTLEKLKEDKALVPSTICATCPVSLWYLTDIGPSNYCRLMHSLTWGGEEQTKMKACDGEHMAQMQRLRRYQTKFLGGQEDDPSGEYEPPMESEFPPPAD